jgi:cold shock CspA family protein
MKRGIVKFFNASQKFGFIASPEDNQEYYVHIKDLLCPVKEGDKVTFEIIASNRGFRAIKVNKEE